MRRLARLSAWLLVLMLAACGALREAQRADAPAAVEDVHRDGTEAGRALDYYAQMRKLHGPELAREQEAARRALSRSGADINRVRYALLLATPGTPGGDMARAQELLEPVARNNDSALQGLALLVTALLQEQQRVEGNAQVLQQKLDALLAIERKMTGRDSAGTRKR